MVDVGAIGSGQFHDPRRKTDVRRRRARYRRRRRRRRFCRRRRGARRNSGAKTQNKGEPECGAIVGDSDHRKPSRRGDLESPVRFTRPRDVIESHGKHQLSKRGCFSRGRSVEQLRHRLFIGDAANRLADQRRTGDLADLVLQTRVVGGVNGIGDHQFLEHRGLHPLGGGA